YLLHVQYGSIPSTIIIALLFMPGPAYATLILQNVVYRDSLTRYGFTLKNVSWRWLFITAAGFVWFVVLGAFLVIAILGNGFGVDLFARVDFSEAALVHQITIVFHGVFGDVPQHPPIPPIALFLLALVQGTI